MAARPGHSTVPATAAQPERARALLDHLVAALAARGLAVSTGRFGAHMRVALVNDNPITLMLEG